MQNQCLRLLQKNLPAVNDAACKPVKRLDCSLQAFSTQSHRCHRLYFIEASNYLVFWMKSAVKLLWHASCKTVWQCVPSRKNKKSNKSKSMSTLEMKGNWNIAKGKLKQKFAQLTDDDLQFVEGKEDELVGRIQKRTGQAQTDIKRVVDECCHGCKH
jgi:uncharacterized protein YjbJ (UPF0337 family)